MKSFPDKTNQLVTEERIPIIKRKKLLYSIYRQWYGELLSSPSTDYIEKKVVVEVGAGPSFIKELMPSVYTTDILPILNIDFTSNGMKLPIKKGVVKKFIMINVFHHIQDSNKFLSELDRCLIKGGKIIMIEPYNTLWGSIIWKYFHHEKFEPKTMEWKVNGDDPLYSANGALPWIVFSRDKELFLKTYSSLFITSIRTHSFLTYILSGGFSYSQLIPDFLINIVTKVDNIICSYFNQLGIFATIEIQKIPLHNNFRVKEK